METMDSTEMHGEVLIATEILATCYVLVREIEELTEDSRFAKAYAALGMMVATWTELSAIPGGYSKIVEMGKELLPILNKYNDTSR